MLQVVQHVKSGDLNLEEVPTPIVRPGTILVKTAASLISAGTEKMVIDLAQKSMAGMARQRPDLVKQVINKAKKEGIKGTYQAVMSKMSKPLALGYSAAGTIIEVGPGAQKFSVGDRVAIAGGGYACHAEINCVPINLAVPIPENVTNEDAAYGTVAAIALQGVRLAETQLGDFVLISGLGLLGLITAQLLKASGCIVVGIDPSAARISQAKALGIDLAIQIGNDDLDREVLDFTNGYGVDKTIITASTKSNQPIEFAGAVTRRKGHVVVVGAVGMNIPRDEYYHKELKLSVSMSYGPGRYDPSYEEGGIDYPYEYVRWTEQRNLQAILQLISSGDLNVQQLTSHDFPIEDALSAYSMIKESSEPFTGILLNYKSDKELARKLELKKAGPISSTQLSLGFIGAGNYATLMLLPNFAKSKTSTFVGLATRTGLSARSKGDQFGFQYVTTDEAEIIADQNIDTIIISTRHASHEELTTNSLLAGKRTFVEKPIAATEEGLERVLAAYRSANDKQLTPLMVGLNRRFAPLVSKIRSEISEASPLQFNYRINCGHIPASSWHHEEAEGGSMLVGEMIHFIDLMISLCGSLPTKVFATQLDNRNSEIEDEDNLSITIKFQNGSAGVIAYNTVGDKGESKERLEIFGAGKAIVLDDFVDLYVSKNGSKKKTKGRGQDKGQSSMVTEIVNSFLKKGESPIPFEELYFGMKAVFAIRKSLSTGEAVAISQGS